MHIAQCSDSFIPVVDGVGRVAYQYSCSLAQVGHECYVITPLQDAGYRGSYPFEILDFLSIQVPKAPQYQTGIALLDRHYVERVSMIKLDIIHVHSPGPSGMEGLRLADKLNIPVVGTFHSKYQEDFRRVTHNDALASLGSRFVTQFYERCDEVWTVSTDAAATLRSYGYKNDVTVVQNGTEMRLPSLELEASARERFVLGEEPILLYVGQIDFKKNLPLIIEAAALLKKHRHAFQLVFAGQGQDKKRLAKLAAEQGLDQVVFTGHISDRSLLDGLYMAASVFVFPSLYDTAGLVVREAAVMGTPSIVVENTAPAEVVTDGVNGLICSNTPESLCGALERYLFGMNEDERAAIREQAQRSIPLPWETVMAEVEARYKAIIAQGRRS
jgi:1,2-diacylglycerol 3-alpha-glucosyltransferase